MSRSRAFGLALALILAAGSAVAEDTSVAVADAWARATPGGAKAGAVYFTVTSAQPDRLLAVESPVASKVGLHSNINDGGVMRMRPVEAIPVEPGKPAALQPGGLHVMLEELKAPLKEGETFPLILKFEKAGEKRVEVRVEKAGARGPAGHGAMHGGKPGS
jgi:copper(I)-binding protein